MSASQQNSRIVLFSLGALAVAMMSCAEPKTDGASIALQVSPGVTLSTAKDWIIAPDGKVTTGTVAVGNSATLHVIISGLPTATGYQLIVSGLASDGVTGCSGSATFNSPTPSTGVPVTLVCGTPSSPGQVLVTSTVNICPVIDGVAASPSSVAVGSSMALQVTAHDPDSGPTVLTYAWTADGGALSGSAAAVGDLHLRAGGNFQRVGRGLGRRRNLRRGSNLYRHLHGALRMISSKVGTSMPLRCWWLIRTSGIVAVALAAVLTSGCSNAPTVAEGPGSSVANPGQSASAPGALSIALVVPPNSQINTISYQLTKTGFAQSGSLNVAQSGTVSGVIGGVPAGTGYTLTLAATDVAQKFTSCAGSSTVAVTAGATTPVSVAIECRLPPVATTTPPAVPVPMPAVALLAVALLAMGAMATRRGGGRR